MSAGAGYEWFVTTQISLGVLARGTAALMSIQETQTVGQETSVSVFVPALLVTATVH